MSTCISADLKTLGNEHPSIATGYDNLGGLLRAQGKYTEAEPLYLRVIEILQTKFGPEDPRTVTAKATYEQLQKLKNRDSR